MLLRDHGLDVHVYSRGSHDEPAARIIEEIGGIFISTDDVPAVADLPDSIGRIDFMLEATGSAAVAAGAMQLVDTNAVLCLLSVTGGSERLPVDVAVLNQRLVMGNGVIVGSVNSNPGHFRAAIESLDRFERRWPGLTERLITRRVPFERFREALEERDDDIKVLIEVAAD
jgi:threonine dehydrogenase-like Zn-dependent dehydrogenase